MCLICYIFMRSVTASYYSQKPIQSILSTLENHTSENQIDFKTSTYITRCSHAQSPMVLVFLQWGDWNQMTPLYVISLTCHRFELPHQLTRLHPISNHSISPNLFKTDMQKLSLGVQESDATYIFWIGNILAKLPSP